MSQRDALDIAVERCFAYLGDPELEARYPNRTCFIGGDNPLYAQMATRALHEERPVVIVYPDGQELLIQLEPSGGARLEARDTSGKPIAA